MDYQEESEGPKLTLDYIKKMLRSDPKTYYSTHELNEVLYLQCKGFSKIENLHLFPDLRCLYIQSNVITKIEGLETLTKLKCLYLNENMISKIEGLEGLSNLRILNLADNRLTKIEGLKDLTQLETFNVSKNNIGKQGLEDLKGILEAPTINSLDISKNDVNDPEILEEIFMKMPSIALINMTYNEAAKKIQSYRKKMIASLPTLKYLDDRPVFADDRRCAEAFMIGGLEEERKEREKIKQEKNEQDERNRKAFEEMTHKAREEAKIQPRNSSQVGDDLETTISTVRSTDIPEGQLVENAEEKKESIQEDEKENHSEEHAEPSKTKEELTRLEITEVNHDIGTEEVSNTESKEPTVTNEGPEGTTKLLIEEINSNESKEEKSEEVQKKSEEEVPSLEEAELDVD
jgi:dynein assembly factor 1